MFKDDVETNTKKDLENLEAFFSKEALNKMKSNLM